MKPIVFGRREFSFGSGRTVLTSTTVTERALRDEDEAAFTRRLIDKYRDCQGTMQIVFKGGRPEYAIITVASTDGEP